MLQLSYAILACGIVVSAVSLTTWFFSPLDGSTSLRRHARLQTACGIGIGTSLIALASIIIFQVT